MSSPISLRDLVAAALQTHFGALADVVAAYAPEYDTRRQTTKPVVYVWPELGDITQITRQSVLQRCGIVTSVLQPGKRNDGAGLAAKYAAIVQTPRVARNTDVSSIGAAWVETLREQQWDTEVLRTDQVLLTTWTHFFHWEEQR